MTRLWLPAVLAAAIVWVVHVSALGDWIVDDAGISYAYARSLAEGHGLVAQPGVEPVEGYTNPLWVLLLSGFIALRWFDPVWTPKVLSGIFVVSSFGCVAWLLTASRTRPGWLAPAALCLTALFPGFAIWTVSGLENSLYGFTAALLAVLCFLGARSPADLRPAMAAGLALFLVFCTRPDGALYFWIYPFLLGIGSRPGRRRRPLGAYVASFIGPWLLLTLFRIVYFRDVMPNTFYAKKGEGVAFFAALVRELPLPGAGIVVAVAGTIVIVAIGVGCAAAGSRLRDRLGAESVQRHVPLLFFLTAILIYHALRTDWMPEYRFATPAFLFGPGAILILLQELTAGRRRFLRRLPLAVTVAFLVFVSVYGYRRTRELADAPALSFQAVQEMAGRLAAVVEPVGSRVTVLTPDIGGALWEDRFEVVDLMGLIDRRLAKAELRVRENLRAHLLHERRPVGVWHHGPWVRRTGLDQDSEFDALYVPVWEERSATDASLRAGFYVRRDVAHLCAFPSTAGS